MKLCLDAGNTRIKWGLHDGRDWCARGELPTDEAGRLAGALSEALTHASAKASDSALGNALDNMPGATLPDGGFAGIWLANVAGPEVGAALAASLHGLGELHTVRSTASAAGVRNGYDRPEQLGVDRWCALIGARHRVAGDCIVVMAGTATTIDTLRADGEFAGGLILPGVRMMLDALHRRTAGLPLASGAYVALPTCTDDAIVSGCLSAQAGAIERAFAPLAGRPGACCLLSGGAAPQLLPLLGLPCLPVENLVLEGLAVLAQAA